MAKETVHIVSHSHWDREWYLPWEEHRMRLVELIDDLIELFETDPNFRSFHLDGQLIVLEDYLEIRPHQKEKLQELIAAGKLVVGPFYILQDDYLITSEANVRNTLIGYLEGKKWGKMPQIGYFPDTFGNMGQAPQLLQQSGMDVAFFGRGVKPIGFDNQVLEDEQFQSHFSEMVWEGADGSQVLGILFANWYSNGNEIPVDKQAAKQFWEKKLADVRQYASTSHYLLMNGCDHQPVQKDLSQALAVARELYPDIEFVHSRLEDYVAAVRSELPENLSTVKGELTSQETDGWYTLTNTASSRIYLKQANDRASHLLEKTVEPLLVLTGDTNARDELRYAWKLLLENAPHDSICGCSVDAVHREMETRFEKVTQVGHFLCQRTLERFANRVHTQDLEGYLFTVVNTAAQEKTQWVEVDLIITQEDFRDGQLEAHYQAMADLPLPSLALYRADGQPIEAVIEDRGVDFAYHLPKDAFRSANFARTVRVTFLAEQLPPFSWHTYCVRPGAGLLPKPAASCLENEFLAISVTDKGQLEWLDKQTGQRFTDFLTFEDTGDVGNEYIYKSPQDDRPLYATLQSFTVQPETAGMTCATMVHTLQVPLAMEDSLEEEQRRLVEFRYRKSKRSPQTKELRVETKLRLYRGQPQLDCSVSFVNEMKDHRLRAVVDLGISATVHRADSIFETVARSNTPHPTWENPSNPQRHRSFVSLSDDTRGLLVASQGLHEYEIVDNHQIALTLLRAVGELGDWGYFPTPDAQCLRPCQARFTIEYHPVEAFYRAVQRAQAFQIDLLAVPVSRQAGELPANSVWTHPVLEESRLCVTALKPAEERDEAVLRYYNLSDQEVAMNHEAQGLDLLEQPIGTLGKTVRPQEIRTERVKRRIECR